MQALDGLQTGARTQMIAEVLFGEERVRQDIEAAEKYILDRARRAAARRRQ